MEEDDNTLGMQVAQRPGTPAGIERAGDKGKERPGARRRGIAGDGRAMTERCPMTARDVRGTSGVNGGVGAGAAGYLLSAGAGWAGAVTAGKLHSREETPEGGGSHWRRNKCDITDSFLQIVS